MASIQQPSPEALLLPLSSRPERSGAERSLCGCLFLEMFFDGAIMGRWPGQRPTYEDENGFYSATSLPGSAAPPFVISTGAQRSGEISVWMPLLGNVFRRSVPGFPTSPATTHVVLRKENHTQLTEAATLDRKSGEAEGSAVQRTFRGNVFRRSVA
jgi:hypothetical protein